VEIGVVKGQERRGFSHFLFRFGMTLFRISIIIADSNPAVNPFRIALHNPPPYATILPCMDNLAFSCLHHHHHLITGSPTGQDRFNRQ
jgi:hypothetical protein